MIIFPAIDLKDGLCVRLMQGDPDRATVYGKDPVAVARHWEAEGAEWLHLVDLDGAFTKSPVNDRIIFEDSPVRINPGPGRRRHKDHETSTGIFRLGWPG